ncbi:LOW QUALITY PROTEIN: ADAMTS-like protein 1 [Colossoma macropomum]|uniref:LOW QUALITY PROTEIN: ADAMTS-like protein 1 n=1 Tax=Colossoma macropomum TaxID=42526 RepID=UPI0018641797|nr:LOW QUALITY PROTEIN: ADAMTS-like protein 1 [Colossoma macropomum]
MKRTGLLFMWWALLFFKVWAEASDGEAVFIREFTLSRHNDFPDDSQNEGPGSHKSEDSSSRTARSEEDRETLWDAWGTWSECSRTCGGGASYSLRRCLSSKACEGQNIKYRTCSNVDCPPESGDFRAQQCSAHADVRYQGSYYEWLPVDNDPENPCALKCRAKGTDLVVELAPKVLDGTRCYTESLDMCISGACQIVGCDHELGSTAKEDNCGVCNGDGSSCRLVRGHYKSQHASGKTEDTVIVIPYGSRHVRLVLKGPDHLYLESKTLQGAKGETSLDGTKQYILENTTIDFQKLSDKEVLRITGPLEADFTVKVHYASGVDSVVQFIFYQPIVHRWRETDFFPCSVTCGGGYQLTSAECFDLRSDRVVVDQYCHYYPENVKPKPKLQECNMDPCPASDGYKQIMPYDLYHPLPRWESSPWTACSTSCGGGVQSRSVSCVEEDMQGNITPTDEWKCLYASKTSILQPCNTFDCPTWLAQEWSPCTVTCGQGLRYRVVLCIDHRGLHAGGCNPTTKPHIKEECLVPVPCYKPLEKLPVEAKPPWFKQAIELEEDTAVSEEPMFIRGAWGPCSRTCGAGTQRRTVKCQVLLSFSQTVADLPDDECEGQKPAESQPCYRSPCPGVNTEQEGERVRSVVLEREELHDWEYEGFTECSETCGGGMKEAVVICLNKQTREATDESECVSTRRPPQLLKACNTDPCPPRWEVEAWSSCSATCGVGLQTRAVTCVLKGKAHSNHTEKVKDEKCRQPKPSSVQACNRFDCPPTWDTKEWSQCSHTCGGGTQKREVVCKQRMADGSVLELPETFCPSPSLPMLQVCGQTDCPAQWVFTDWTQCSATCGEGTQRLLVVCRRKEQNGQYQTLVPEACASLTKPSTARSCSAGPCEKTFKSVAAKPDPAILAQKKVYIQWRKGPKLHFVVGGYAYLLPWTSIVLRCPTRHFRKGHVRWLKDGKPLALLPHVSISHMGYIKIQQVRASDVGMYTCVAGQAQENFVLKLIGGKQKISVPEADFWITDGVKSSPKTHQMSSVSEETAKEVLSFNRYDAVVQHLLDLKNLALEGYVSKELLDSAEKNRSILEEDTVLDPQSPQVLVADMPKLDEVTRNLSGGVQGPVKDELITQLLEELTKNTGENNESTLEPNDRQEFSTQGYISQRTGLRMPSHSTRQWRGHLRSPVIIQRPLRGYKFPNEIVAHVGSLVLVPRQAIRLELRCQAQGNPQPVTIWTKDGMELTNSSRVGLMPDGSLHVDAPRETDSGLYTCRATNHLGSTSLSSQVQITDNLQSSHSCHGQHCRHRWQVSSWSSCSVSCGGGIQSRSVTCLGVAEGAEACLGAGRRPAETRPCNTQLCVSWVTTSWGPCNGQCVGPKQALQHRHVFCQDKNSTRVAHRMCSSQPRPLSHQNCTSEACALHWRVGPWTQCTATCGRHGFQSRHVTCVHRRSGKPAREFHCAWRPRPASWQRCNILSCGRGECRDSTRYCEKVRQLELCPLPQFKARCCRSCRDT